jgi:hypothetical protein
MTVSSYKRQFGYRNSVRPPMSALGQKQTFALQKAMSALPPIATTKADIPEQNELT